MKIKWFFLFKIFLLSKGRLLKSTFIELKGLFMNYKLFLMLVLSFLHFNSIKAQTCCSGGIPLSNNLGLPILEKGTLQIGINYDYNNLNTLNNGDEKLADDSRLRITNSILLNASYSINNNLSVEGLFTWVNQIREISQFNNVNKDETSGVGDAVILAKYNFQNPIGENSSVSLGLGTKIPLGSSTETNSQGIVLNADLQPGSNVWDIIYWSSMSKSFNFRPSLNVSSRLIYRSTGTNNSYFGDSTYKFGNEFQSFIGFSDQFIISKLIVNPGLSIKYRNSRRDKIGGFEIENTGGDWVFITPNLSVDINSNIVFSTTLEIPVYSNVIGTQLTPTYRFTSGLLFKIPAKKEFEILN